MSPIAHKSLARRAQNSSGTGCLWLFFGLFLLVGSALLFFLTIWPAMHVLAAKGWEKTPCIIDSSQLARSSGKGTTYSIDIVYHYYRDGHLYSSNRYSFAVGKTSGRSSKEAVVRRYPAGTETFCYVNPGAPQEAVMDRGLQTEFAFGFLGLLFMLPAVLGIVFRGQMMGNRKVLPDGLPVATPSDGSPSMLKPASTPLGKFLGMLAFAGVWNGFISIFVYLCFFAKDAHTAPFFAKAIVSLFALIGVLLVFGVFSTFLALFNPRIRLTAPTLRVSLGGEFAFSWTVTGRTGMLRKIRLVFEGREEAIYKRGTRTSTDTCVFAEIPVFETSDASFIAQGNARVVVPANLMHTLEAAHNKVLWRLKVSGEIPRWPDIADEYPIVVLPLPLAR